MNHSNHTKCSHCGVSLNHIDDQPCHNCGKTGTEIYAIVSETATGRDDFITRPTSGKTNRSTIHSNSRNPTDTVKIQQLIISFVEDGADDLTPYIDTLVKKFNTALQGKNRKFYRGVDISVKKHLSSNKIGPAPAPKDGRYNAHGAKCIYLIDNIDFLNSELKSTCILVQKFEVPVNTFKIADISPSNNNLHNSLGLAFNMAENGKTSSGYNFAEEIEKRGKSKYLVSQLLSSSFKRNGWDGIYIPGVHGSPGRHYHNCTIFSTVVDQWEDWAIGSYFLNVKMKR